MRTRLSRRSLPKALSTASGLLAGLLCVPLAARAQPPATPQNPTAPPQPPTDPGGAPPPPTAPAPAVPPTQSVPPTNGQFPPPPPPPAQPYSQGPYGQPYGPTPYPGAPPPYAPYPQPPNGAAPISEPPPPEPPWPTLPEPEFRRHRLTLQTESVFSADEGPFYNHLLGGRYDFQTTRAASVGLYAGYANLKGTGKRVHSALVMGQLQYRLYFGSSQRFFVPLRAGIGYLFKNGLVVRFATGPYFAISDDFEIGLDLIAPTFWTASNDTVISMNVAAEATLVF